MAQRWMRGVAAATTLLGSSIGGAAAVGQTSPSFAPPPAAPAVGAALANPYMNPYLNPYLNPLATVRPMTGRDAAISLYMANSAQGGLGSGVISGTRPTPANLAGAAAARPRGKAPRINANAIANARANPNMANQPLQNGRRPVAEMPDSAAFPGSGAARFFNPGPVNVGGAGRYYNRRNTYFNSNGH